MSEKIDPKKDPGVYIDGGWMTLPDALIMIRKEHKRLVEEKEKKARVSGWDRVWVTVLTILLPFIVAGFMQDIWSSDLDLSTRLLLTFTVLFTNVVIGVLAWFHTEG